MTKVYVCPKCNRTNIEISSRKMEEPTEQVNMDDLPEKYNNYPTFGGWGTSSLNIEYAPYEYTATCKDCGYTVKWTKDLQIYGVTCLT